MTAPSAPLDDLSIKRLCSARRYLCISLYVETRDEASGMVARVGECASGIMRMWPGLVSDGKVVGVESGPLAVVRYVSVAIEVMRCVERFGLERQKKHSCGVVNFPAPLARL